MKTHGQTGTRLYRIWKKMIRRCMNPNDDNYHKYGARGVIVCERWRAFENFMSDMGQPPTDRHQIDRRESTGNYEPGNCRWATPTQQSANKTAISGKKGSRFKGVHPRKQRWVAIIGARRLGSFASEEDAARAYDKAALEQYGEFAQLNFGDDRSLVQ